MHELSLAEEIATIVESHSTRLHSVTSVRLRIGTLAGVEIDALRFALASVLRDTKAAAASIEVAEVLAQGTCPNCGLVQPIEQRYDPCSSCGTFGLALNCGDEFQVMAITGVD